MLGRIAGTNPAAGLAAVLTEEGTYTVFELPGALALEIGDEVAWGGTRPVGAATIENFTRDLRLEVNFVRHGVDAPRLRDLVLCRDAPHASSSAGLARPNALPTEGARAGSRPAELSAVTSDMFGVIGAGALALAAIAGALWDSEWAPQLMLVAIGWIVRGAVGFWAEAR